jgi:hypothetical protein
MTTDTQIPLAHRAWFDEIAALIAQFGQIHLDAELTGFSVELWRRLCRRKAPDCLRGKPEVWAASVIHVIARINFLSDSNEPGHLTFDTVCDFFHTSKNTIGGKATLIERTLKLRQHSEPGLCRPAILEQFTMVELSNGMVLPFASAKEMGYLPANAMINDLK